MEIAQRNLVYYATSDIIKGLGGDGSASNVIVNESQELTECYFVPFYFLTYQFKENQITIRVSGATEHVDCFINNYGGFNLKAE